MAARDSRAGVAQRDAAHTGRPPQPRRLTRRARASARETGEAASATVELNAGGFSGETIYSTTFAMNMRIYW